MIILSLVERDLAAMRRAILSAPEKADAVEVRLDAIPHADPGLLFEGSPRPLIATCRRKGDGGFYTGSESKRRDILFDAVKAGATWIDVEHGSGAEDLAGLLSDNPAIGVILSHHDTRKMPTTGASLYRAMARVKGVKAIKIVGTARNPSDNLIARVLLEKRRKGPPLIAFCMGGPGTLSRIMALEWGSWATYSAVAVGKLAAPGQVTLADLLGIYRIEDIDDDTCLAGIVGHPLGHTLSPAIHNAAFHAQGVNFRYVPIDIPTAAGLADLKRLARGTRLRGLSVTRPWKLRILDHLDAVEPLASAIGAVNTVVCDGRRLLGFNTDATGGMEALRERLEELGHHPKGMRAVVVGSGGAARALAYGVVAAGMKLIVSSRRPRPGQAIARSSGGRWVALAHLGREKYDVLINCTSIGMDTSGGMDTPGPQRGPSMPVTLAAIKGRLIYDVIYSPVVTPLMRAATRKGIPTLGGLEMLVRQASEQYTLFTGRTAPMDVMREAARQALGVRRDDS